MRPLMQPFPIILPRDNEPLSPSDIILAKSICSTVQGLVDNREKYIQASEVDPNFAFPQANWSLDSPNEFVRVYKNISAGRPEIISNLRLFAQVFTGFNMIHVIPGFGLSSPETLPEDLDAKINNNLTAYLKEWPRRWRTLVKNIPERAIYRAPKMLGEVGLEVDGVLVNNDVIVYQERINLLYEVGLIEWLEKRLMDKGTLRILEIGGGYGAIASWFKTVFPECSYALIDLPECLIFSSLYLSLINPEISRNFGVLDESVGWRFIPNYMAEKLTGKFDLVINTLSMSEMSQYQVEQYMKMMRQFWLVDGGLFFEQNQNNRNRGLICAEDIIKNKLPHRARIMSSKTPLTQGTANIWGMNEIPLPRKGLNLPGFLKSFF
jgi:hypothetical protein